MKQIVAVLVNNGVNGLLPITGIAEKGISDAGNEGINLFIPVNSDNADKLIDLMLTQKMFID